MAFIAMATSGLGMLSEGDIASIESVKAWAGLGFYTCEIEKELREINAQI